MHAPRADQTPEGIGRAAGAPAFCRSRLSCHAPASGFPVWQNGQPISLIVLGRYEDTRKDRCPDRGLRARAGAVAAVVAGPGVAAGARAGGGTRHQPQYRGGGVQAAGGRRHRVDAGAAGHGDPRSLRRGRAGRRLARYAADRSGQRQSPAGMAAGHGAGVRRPTVPAPALRRADGQSGPGDLWARLAGAGLSGVVRHQRDARGGGRDRALAGLAPGAGRQGGGRESLLSQQHQYAALGRDGGDRRGDGRRGHVAPGAGSRAGKGREGGADHAARAQPHGMQPERGARGRWRGCWRAIRRSWPSWTIISRCCPTPPIIRRCPRARRAGRWCAR